MSHIELWQLIANIVTVFGLPVAIYIFMLEQSKERENEDEEVYQLLSDAYSDFLKLVLANPDLRLRTQSAIPNLTDEQRERRMVLFDILISLFERAYLTAYDESMSDKQRRRWHSWDDFMREWCRRDDFRAALPKLLQGEDEDFAAYIQQIAKEEVTSIADAASTMSQPCNQFNRSMVLKSRRRFHDQQDRFHRMRNRGCGLRFAVEHSRPVRPANTMHRPRPMSVRSNHL